MADQHFRKAKERRTAHRWSLSERRSGGERRDGAYKEFARALPARFLKMNGTPRERVLYLVSEYCRGCDESLQVDLAQALLPTLQTVISSRGDKIFEDHRLECEAAVERCVKRNELETGRWHTACAEGEVESD